MGLFKRDGREKDVLPVSAPVNDNATEREAAAQKALDRADRWLEAVFKEADKVFVPARKPNRGRTR